MAGDGGLMIGGAHDPAEKAADAMAERVMAAPAGPVAHRKCAACEGEAGTRARRSTATPVAAPAASAAPASKAASQAVGEMSGGKPLSHADRSFFEPRFGADFSAVRLHEDGPADRAARAMDASAFTLGTDIAFAKGERGRGGRGLMAHELAHVVEEGGAARRTVRRFGDTSQIPSGLTCPVRDISSGNPQVGRFQFNISSTDLTNDAKAELSGIAAGFHALGGTLSFEVDGFASTDGPQGLNWTLSCQRAEAVKRELESPSDGSAGVPAANVSVFANGETSQFGRSLPANRVAVLRSDQPFAPVSCAQGNAETRASACLQPVVIADDDGSNPTAPPDFAEVQRIWEKCCIDIGVAASITVEGNRFKEIENAPDLTPTQEELDMIDAAGISTDCVPVFIVDTILLSGNSGKDVSGGGYTLTDGLPGPHLVVVEGGSSWLVAHELGHAFDVHHNLSPRADGQPTIAGPTGSHSAAGSDRVSDDICLNSRASGPVTAGGGSPAA